MPSEKDEQQQAYLLNRLLKRDRHLAKWGRRTETDCYRVYDRDIPEIPLVVERYGDEALLALFERPYEKPEDEELAWLELMKQATSQALAIAPDNIHVKVRRRLGVEDQYEKTSAPEAQLKTVHEHGLAYLVNLHEYLDTGLFMDHRPLRQRLRSEAGGMRVLNLFCYTGSFSVCALAGGAALVHAVDLSNTYLAWAERNIRLNGVDTALYQGIRADAIEFLKDAAYSTIRYDRIILDPPTFSNSKKMTGFLDTNRHWPELVQLCAKLLAPDGLLYFSTNSRDLRFDAALLPELNSRDISASTIPEDFRPNAHKAWEISR